MAAILNEDPLAISQVLRKHSTRTSARRTSLPGKEARGPFSIRIGPGLRAGGLVRIGNCFGDRQCAVAGLADESGLDRWTEHRIARYRVIIWWMSLRLCQRSRRCRQLTNDGNLKSTFSTIVSDGSRVYFDEMDSGKLVSMQVSATGGQATPVPTTLKTNGGIAGLAPDNSALIGIWTRIPERLMASATSCRRTATIGRVTRHVDRCWVFSRWTHRVPERPGIVFRGKRRGERDAKSPISRVLAPGLVFRRTENAFASRSQATT